MPHSETWIDGVYYPSVTTIMNVKPKPWLEDWKNKWGILAVRKTKIAGAVGTEWHRCIDSLLNTGVYRILPPAADGIAMPSLILRVKGMMKSYEAWLASISGELLATELKVVSRRYIYSGTLDAIIRSGNKIYVADWKTSARIYDDYGMQLSAYSQAYREETDNHAKLGIIVCVSKDKPHFKLTTKEFKLGKRVFKQFMNLRETFDEARGG